MIGRKDRETCPNDPNCGKRPGKDREKIGNMSKWPKLREKTGKRPGKDRERPNLREKRSGSHVQTAQTAGEKSGGFPDVYSWLFPGYFPIILNTLNHLQCSMKKVLQRQQSWYIQVSGFVLQGRGLPPTPQNTPLLLVMRAAPLKLPRLSTVGYPRTSHHHGPPHRGSE